MNTPTQQLSAFNLPEPQTAQSQTNTVTDPVSPSVTFSIQTNPSTTNPLDTPSHTTPFPRLPASAFPAQMARAPTYPSSSPELTAKQHHHQQAVLSNVAQLSGHEPYVSAPPAPSSPEMRKWRSADSNGSMGSAASPIDGGEPKLLPGMVSRAETARRRSSVVKRRRSVFHVEEEES